MTQFEDFDSPTQQSNPEPQSLSLLGGIAGANLNGDNEFSGEAVESKKLAQQSAIIVLIVSVVAFGALMGMRMTQSSGSAEAASQETIAFFDNFDSKRQNAANMDPNDPMSKDSIGNFLKSAEEVVRVIQADRTEKHVPIEQVKKNPFTLFDSGPKAPEVDTAAVAEAKRKKALEGYYSELARVKIQSLVGGGRPRAFIGGELYKIGDTLGSFEIVGIDHRSVTFTVPGFELRKGEASFVLGMDND